MKAIGIADQQGASNLFFSEFPSPQVVCALEPEELGAKILFHLKGQGGHRLHMQDLTYQVQQHFPGQGQDEVLTCLVEAWSWLEAQGFLVPKLGSDGHSGFRQLSRRAKKLESETSVVTFAEASRLPKENLHERIRQKVWSAFVRGEYDVAVFQAMKAVEVSVREASGLSASMVGEKLMREAFDPDKGPLTDRSAEKGERLGLAHLFAGAMGYLRNSHGHRDVPLDSPAEAMEVVMFASYLLRVVDAAKARTEKAA